MQIAGFITASDNSFRQEYFPCVASRDIFHDFHEDYLFQFSHVIAHWEIDLNRYRLSTYHLELRDLLLLHNFPIG